MEFFKIEQIDGSSKFVARVESKHKIFEGHFPGNPVVPGVCSLAMIKDCCSRLLSRPVRYDYIKEVKFLSAIIPTVHKELSVAIELDEQLNLKANIVYGEQIMLKLKAVIV